MSASEHRKDADIQTALPESLSWQSRPQHADLAPLPGYPAVYLLLTDQQVPIQLGTTQHLRRLAISRLTDLEQVSRGKADLAEIARGIRWREVHSAFEGRWWYYRLARQMYPKRYRHLISFGPAWFLRVDWQQPIPELTITNRIWCEPGEYLGPWLTHDTCQQALTGLWDLFDLCRYPEQVRRAPHGQSCAYAEMGRCDAPCDGSAPFENYQARCRAAWSFTCGNHQEWLQAAERKMNAAAAAQRFEEAGQVKQQLDFVAKWQKSWAPALRRSEQMNDLFVIPVTRRRSWKLFLFRQGCLTAGPVMTQRRLPGALTIWLSQELARPLEDIEPRVRMEQTWLVTHFCNSHEGDASFLGALGSGRVPEGLEQKFRDFLTQRRAMRAPRDDATDDAQSLNEGPRRHDSPGKSHPEGK
ncbi:MAG: hypothetical protein ABIG44_08160 [Planctomycetota bacterium]